MDKETPHTLFGDGLRIKQILSKLLSNAYKYTETGEIRMSVTVEPSVSIEPKDKSDNVTLILQISDTGQGMTQAQLKKLFDAYTRFNAEENRDVVGTGLGMNITKHLVEMMKGVINVESEAGKGTVVTVRLPQKSCGGRICGAGIAEELRTFSFSNKLISRMAKIVHKQMPGGRILVVDDVNANLYVAQGLMQPYGLHIETVNSGFKAIEKIKNNEEFDIIFMDYMMPKMDGIKATKIIRETGYTKPIVAFTANAFVGQAEMFLANGFDAFIAKPIDSYELDQILKRFIKDNEATQSIPLATQSIPPATQSIPPATQSIPIDSSKVKKIFILDAENTITVLKELSAKWHVRPDSLNDEELESYIVTVHGIKSALNSIGEKELSAAAYKLEQAGKCRDFNLIANETPAFFNALLSLVEKFKTPEADHTIEMSNEDKEFLRRKLGEIKAACEKFNVKAAKKALADLKQKTWPPRVDDICDKISVTLLCGEFKKAAAEIEIFIGNHR
ncbi:MAG: ATP-binding protein [Treponema sp.]|nr:ATP-binding protein [Treponema sp.]